MIRCLLYLFLLTLTVTVQAEQSGHGHALNMNHAAVGVSDREAQTVRPLEPGQSAFAAIQEVVSILDADPNTDWSKVDIEALRQHLIDMNNVTLYSDAVATRVENGWRYTITGSGPVRESIRRMVKAHAVTMDGRDGWQFASEEHPEGAILAVRVSDPVDVTKLRALGFTGIMVYGMHHQEHHMMIATGGTAHH